MRTPKGLSGVRWQTRQFERGSWCCRRQRIVVFEAGLPVWLRGGQDASVHADARQFGKGAMQRRPAPSARPRGNRAPGGGLAARPPVVRWGGRCGGGCAECSPDRGWQRAVCIDCDSRDRSRVRLRHRRRRQPERGPSRGDKPFTSVRTLPTALRTRTRGLHAKTQRTSLPMTEWVAAPADAAACRRR